jgi:two-component system cell cycle sensor histidine kinase/response regulator CckA
MIEREQYRVDASKPHAFSLDQLSRQHGKLVESVACTALERGYGRYIPDLQPSLEGLVSRLSQLLVQFATTEPKSAFHPGEDFRVEPLACGIRREVAFWRARGVDAVMLCGLLQQCRAAFQRTLAAELTEHGAALIELAFDRFELGLVATCAEPTLANTAEDRRSPASVDGIEFASEVERVVSVRTKELQAKNEHMRRQLDRLLRAEEERDLYYRAMLHSQKIEAVGALAGGVAHDLNNLFQVLRCNVDLLRERADKTTFGMLEEMTQVTDRAVGLVRQLLLFSRKQPMARRVLDVGEVVRDLLRLLRRVIPENVQLFSQVEDHLPLVRADISALEQLVVNLIINARDSMPRGGTIHVNVSRQRRVPPERIRATSSLEQVAIIVRDVGTGIPEDVLTRIFDPFFSTKRQGSGLGLSVVHGVAEEHGGWVEVTSAIGQGSCFAIYLPAIDHNEVVEAPSEARTATVLPGHGEHLLLVEDEDIVRKALARELTREGYSVQSVRNAEEGLAIYRRAPGHFACVISDGLMPGISGPEMVLEMLKDNAQQRAIFISSYAPTMDCWHDLRTRGFPLLAKPFSTKELVAKLRELLERDQEPVAATLRNGPASSDRR